MSLRVLLVEDNPQNRLLAKATLGFSGYSVIEAENGASAFAALERVAVDVVLLDLQLPDIDGFEVARRLQSDPRFQHLPLIAVTSFVGPEQRNRVLAAGFRGFIEKPIDVSRFAEQVADYGQTPHL